MDVARNAFARYGPGFSSTVHLGILRLLRGETAGPPVGDLNLDDAG
jgi:hypothetical protein